MVAARVQSVDQVGGAVHVLVCMCYSTRVPCMAHNPLRCVPPMGRFTRQEDVSLLKSSAHRRKISKEALLDLLADMCVCVGMLPPQRVRTAAGARVCVRVCALGTTRAHGQAKGERPVLDASVVPTSCVHGTL